MDWVSECRVREIRALVLDVRGTLIHSEEDEPMSCELADALIGLYSSGIIIALNTATSQQSLERLFFEPIVEACDRASKTAEIILYADSGTLGYSYSVSGGLQPLGKFDCMELTPEEVELIVWSTNAISEIYDLRESTLKIKNGQINFYCGGSWDRRRAMGTVLEEIYGMSSSHRICVMVPTTKATIDIAVCRKDRGVADLKHRFQLNDADLLMIGDSMQIGAPDRDMLAGAPRSLAIQVGPVHTSGGIFHVSTDEGMIGTQDVILKVVEIVRSRGHEL